MTKKYKTMPLADFKNAMSAGKSGKVALVKKIELDLILSRMLTVRFEVNPTEQKCKQVNP